MDKKTTTKSETTKKPAPMTAKRKASLEKKRKEAARQDVFNSVLQCSTLT